MAGQEWEQADRLDQESAGLGPAVVEGSLSHSQVPHSAHLELPVERPEMAATR